MKNNRLLSMATALTLTLAAASFGERRQTAPLEIGTQAPDFNLPGVDWHSYQLADFAGATLPSVITLTDWRETSVQSTCSPPYLSSEHFLATTTQYRFLLPMPLHVAFVG